MINLSEEIKEFQSSIEFELDILSSNLPVNEIEELCDHIGLGLRTLAKGHLLVSGQQNRFHYLMRQSAKVRRFYLKCCRQNPSYKAPLMASSWGSGIFDAIAAFDFDLAIEISKLSPTTWWQDSEYEEDFYYYLIIRSIIEKHTDKKTLKNYLASFETTLQGDESARYNICRVLIDLDTDCFEDSFGELLMERENDIAEEADRFFNDAVVYYVKTAIFTEGLAILNIADMLGFETLGEYRFCPFIARKAPDNLSSASAILNAPLGILE